MVVKGEIEEDPSRNLLQSFVGNHEGDSSAEAGGGGGDTCEVQLSLGLSLNGCFGVEPKEKRLIRSSSISSFSIFPIEHNVPLTRACSLPAETEEERRKRKEMESFNRMEAKRKRSEKKLAKDRKDGNFDECLNNLPNGNNTGGQIFGGKMNGVVGNGFNGGSRPASQGSIGSQGSSSPSVSEFESKPVQGLGNCAQAKSPLTTTLPPSNHSNQERDEPWKKKEEEEEESCKAMRSMTEEMPNVSTRGEGPDGRRIQGFLYNYRRGGEVRIVCVCHGQFLTPAEFVKHAGGGDVDHPLRHILVNPTPALL